jgi:hypothetical protein
MRPLLKLFCSVTLLAMALGLLVTASAAYGRSMPAPAWERLTQCSQPCWANVLPGITTIREAHRLYTESLGLLVSPRFYRTPNDAPFRWVVNRVPLSPALTADEPVPVLYVQPTTRLTAGELVARYGQPDRVQTAVVLTGTDCATHPGERCIVFTLIYDKLGMDAATDPLLGYSLPPGAPIFSFTFARNPDYLADGNQPWRGFGTFATYRLVVP